MSFAYWIHDKFVLFINFYYFLGCLILNENDKNSLTSRILVIQNFLQDLSRLLQKLNKRYFKYLFLFIEMYMKNVFSCRLSNNKIPYDNKKKFSLCRLSHRKKEKEIACAIHS